ncbi:hydrolase [Clostridia bacterium]|nr:hydrolase [Clostridia bacterium]
MRVSDNAEMLEITDENYENCTIYPVLVWDSENLALIDAGFPGQFDLFKAAIAKVGLGRGISEITHIFLTHQDWDHIGCASEILSAAKNAKTYAHKDEAPYIDGREKPIKGGAKPPEMLFKIDRELSDGEIVPICGGIEAVHTPGHTPGHSCFLLRESNILVCGDAVNVNNGELAGPNPAYTFDMELGMKSFEKIKSLTGKAIVAYHGGII